MATVGAIVSETLPTIVCGASPCIRNGTLFWSTRYRPFALTLSGNAAWFVTVHVNGGVLAVTPWAATVTTTEWLPTLAGESVPEIRPVAGSIAKPVGSPVALNVTVSPSGSLAVTFTSTVAY